MDCLPLVEEFFDGEVDENTGERMRAHLASCAECAAAFDALGAEQEMFLRYDRELEVTPALWHGVRARIADAQPEPRPRSLFSQLSERFAAAFAMLALRPSFASALALLMVGVTAGLLWQLRPAKTVPATEVAHIPTSYATPGAISGTPEKTEPQVVTPSDGANPVENPPSVAEVTGPASVKRAPKFTTAGYAPERVPANKAAASRGVVDINVHAVNDDPLISVAPLAPDDLADVVAQLDPADEAVARHVEKAQMLLRSFKNSRPAEGVGDLAYERELSRKLLDENISLQLDADAAENKTAKRVLSSLEPYLLDISNLRERPTRGDVRSIKERMQKQEIIAALHVYDD
jgi:hypothetical protein